MCTPSLPKDTSAEQAATANATRQANVTAGQNNIDSAFSKFDKPYFDSYTKSYEGNYNPQVDEQFGIAQQNERYAAARKGTLDSTPAIHANDLLNTSYGQQKQKIASDALNATQGLENTVQQQKTNLYGLNSSAADPTLASSQAAASAGTIPSTPQYSVLGDLFGGLVNGAASYVGANNNNTAAGYGQRTFQAGSGLPGGSGSGRIVG
jgi:hypothetical protein